MFVFQVTYKTPVDERAVPVIKGLVYEKVGATYNEAERNAHRLISAAVAQFDRATLR